MATGLDCCLPAAGRCFLAHPHLNRPCLGGCFSTDQLTWPTPLPKVTPAAAPPPRLAAVHFLFLRAAAHRPGFAALCRFALAHRLVGGAHRAAGACSSFCFCSRPSAACTASYGFRPADVRRPPPHHAFKNYRDQNIDGTSTAIVFPDLQRRQSCASMRGCAPLMNRSKKPASSSGSIFSF
jgi:hypothetical protein